MIIFVGVTGQDFLIIENFDICRILNLGDQGFFGSKMRAAMNEKNFFCNVGKIRGSEKSGIATTDNSDGLVLIKGAVTSRTIGDAVADELGFINEIEATWSGAGSENDGFGSVSLIASESEMGGGFFEMLNFVVGEGKAEGFQLLINMFGKFGATDFGKTGIIFNNGGL